MLNLSGLLLIVRGFWNAPCLWSKNKGRRIKALMLVTAGAIGWLALVVAGGSQEASAVHAAALGYEARGGAAGTPSPSPTLSCGPAWTVVTSPDPGTTYNDLNGVTGSGNDVWAVGEYFNSAVVWRTLTMHWDGSAWSVVPSPNFGTSNNNFLTDATGSGNDVWAVGDYLTGPFPNKIAHALTLHWNGSVWSQVAVPIAGTSSELHGVTGSGNDVWAVGRYTVNQTEQTLTMHWDGSAWSIVPSPNIGQNTIDLYGVTGSGNDVWAVGTYDIVSLTLTMHWDGSAWSIVPSPSAGKNTNVLAGVAGSGSDVWAVGNYSNNDDIDRTLTLHWDGSAWSQVPNPNIEKSGDLLEGVTGSGSDVWAVGFSGQGGPDQTLAMHWDGSAWSIVPSPNADSDDVLYGATGTGNDVWGVGYYHSGGVDQTLTLHWTDQCTTSTPVPSSSPTRTSSPTPTHGAGNSPTVTSTATGTATGTVQPTSTATDTSTPEVASSTPTATVAASATATNPSTPTACALTFSDVPPGSTFYPYIHCLACLGLINGYPNGTFKPNNDVTRGQLSKIVANAAGFIDPQPTQMFQDVPLSSTFQVYIGRLASRGYISGYPCGQPGEPCVPPDNLPYFRPNANATRGQISKIVSNAAGFADPPSGQQFQDVAPGSTYYTYTYRLVSRGVMSGYPCGTPPAGPCVPPANLPYFLPNANATRGQTSKIVANTFFPACQSP